MLYLSLVMFILLFNSNTTDYWWCLWRHLLHTLVTGRGIDSSHPGDDDRHIVSLRFVYSLLQSIFAPHDVSVTAMLTESYLRPDNFVEFCDGFRVPTDRRSSQNFSPRISSPPLPVTTSRFALSLTGASDQKLRPNFKYYIRNCCYQGGGASTQLWGVTTFRACASKIRPRYFSKLNESEEN